MGGQDELIELREALREAEASRDRWKKAARDMRHDAAVGRAYHTRTTIEHQLAYYDPVSRVETVDEAEALGFDMEHCRGCGEAFGDRDITSTFGRERWHSKCLSRYREGKVRV